MGTQLFEQLKDVKLDYSAYGALPILEDVVLIAPQKPEDVKLRTVFKQWEKLNYLRKHLRILDGYIRFNKGLVLKDWLAIKKCDLSNHVVEKIGDHNNDTGGISAYFFNLQNYYDEQEHHYDNMEALSTVPPDIKRHIDALRVARRGKRKMRGEMRRLQMRDLKKSDKGYLVIEVEEPANVMHNADGGEQKETAPPPKPDVKKPESPKPDDKPAMDVLTKVKSNITVWIAGTAITLTVVALAVGLSGGQK